MRTITSVFENLSLSSGKRVFWQDRIDAHGAGWQLLRGIHGPLAVHEQIFDCCSRVRSHRMAGKWTKLNHPSTKRFLLVALALVLAVACIYGRMYGYEFITFDDDTYILDNPEVTNGLTWEGLRWSFGYHASNWHPLTWLSHMLDSQLFGRWAGGHHLMSAGIHAFNALILLGVLTATTGAFWRSATVAALFALHPLRVESVSWAAERKDVLSALFWLLAWGLTCAMPVAPASPATW